MIRDNDPRRYLFFDTETTGVPKDYRAPVTDSENWPRLVQLAWIFQAAGEPDQVGNDIIYPDGFKIPEDASAIHGITTEIAKEKGVPLANTLSKFLNLVDRADLMVGHNISFDINIVRAEIHRVKLDDALEGKGSLCTMMKSTNYCKMPKKDGRKGYKWPTLHELYFTLFNKGFEDAHDARGDISATVKCFWKLYEKQVILL